MDEPGWYVGRVESTGNRLKLSLLTCLLMLWALRHLFSPDSAAGYVSLNMLRQESLCIWSNVRMLECHSTSILYLVRPILATVHEQSRAHNNQAEPIGAAIAIHP